MQSAKIIREARATRGPGKKSPAYRWMEIHFEELAAGDLSWSALAGELNKAGMRNADGRPLTAGALHSAWQRLKASKGLPSSGQRPSVTIIDDVSATVPREMFDPGEFKIIGKNKDKP